MAAAENSIPVPAAHAPWKPSHNPWLIALAVMLAPFMEVLDTSVANVALPHIGGNLSATPEEATWVLTSYLVSNAIVLPMTGWLGNYFGRRRLLLICVALFTVASVLCGMATSLSFLVCARILQGLGGGCMVPIAQAILLESFPVSKRGAAMAAFSMGIIVAPILGPTLGGWITDNYSWRWIFYINVPVGILAFLLAEELVEDPPYIGRNRSASVDWAGFALLALWLGTLQIVLDRGQEKDWFQSDWICWMTAISVVSFIAMLIREFTAEHPVVDLRVLKNRNFATGVVLITMVGVVLYGTTAAIPIYLQTLMGYTALGSGLTLSPRGLAAFAATIVVGRLIGKVKNRYLLFTGFFLVAMSSFLLSRINLSVDMSAVVWPSLVNGLGISFIFVPLTTSTVAYLRQDQMGNATGLYNLMRNIGGSLGIAFVTTMLDRDAQIHQSSMMAHVTPYDPAYVQQLAAAQSALSAHVDPVTAAAQAQFLIYNQVLQQAKLWAFVDNFRLFGFLCLACMPVVFFFRKVKPRPGAPMDAH
ncbi:MAG: DHA2 family efflux MFS transporter permease subunit [Verrucomicrobiota bacterium]